MIDLLLPAFFLSLVLLGIHSYYGIRIIQRNIIFTDLAIGQMAAFGAAMSIVIFGESESMIYLMSLGFALLSGLVISLMSKRSEYLEAVIGLMYALGVSGIFIVLNDVPHGIEKIKELMACDILYTSMADVYRTAILYIVIGAILFFIERKARGIIKEILFFTTFAVTVTSSVKLAGVLVVFSVLLAPAFIAIHLAVLNKVGGFIKKNLLIWSWIIGLLINFLSIILSVQFDLPTGYTLVFVNALFAVSVAIIIKTAKDRGESNEE